MVDASEYVSYFRRRDVGVLFIKACLKLAAILLLAIQLAYIHPFAMIALLFFAYFTLPAQYRIDEPYKAAEAWFRPIIGIFIAIAIAWILTPGFSFSSMSEIIMLIFYLFLLGFFIFIFSVILYSIRNRMGYVLVFVVAIILTVAINAILTPMLTSAITISLLIFAFYAVPPVRIRYIGNQPINVNITIIGKNSRKLGGYIEGLLDPENRSIVGNTLFVSIMATAFVPLWSMSAGVGPTGGIPILSISISTLQLIVFAFWLISFLMGLAGGPLGRPYIGILMIGLATLLFSYQYTGVVGTALFGAWWPSIEQGLSVVAEPVGNIASSVGQQMTCLQLLITSPAMYAATPGCGAPLGPPPKAVGTTRAIEITRIEYVNYATGEQNINPLIPLVGSIEIENKGDFVANNINVSIGDIQLKDPTKVSAAHPGEGYTSLDEFDTQKCCVGLDDLKDLTSNKQCEASGNWAGNNCYFESCTGATFISSNKKLCSWTDELGIFPGYKALMTFKCGDPKNNYKNWSYATAEVTVGEKRAIIYCPAGWYVSIPVIYEYQYTANASLPVEIMNATVFQKKWLAKDITPDEKQATFTGGPVEISIWTQKQPLRSDEPSYGRFIITNKGDGTIKNLTGKLTLQVPEGMEITDLSHISGECRRIKPSSKFVGYVDFVLSEIAPNTNPHICTFEFKYKITDDSIEKKSTIFVAKVDYSYQTKKKIELPISNAPIQ